MQIEVHCGVVWVYKIGKDWYEYIRAFPEAVDKKGNPKLDHQDVVAYTKKVSPV